MTDMSHAGAGGPSYRAVEIGVAIAMIVFGALVIYGSLQVGIGLIHHQPGFGQILVGRLPFAVFVDDFDQVALRLRHLAVLRGVAPQTTMSHVT